MHWPPPLPTVRWIWVKQLGLGFRVRVQLDFGVPKLGTFQGFLRNIYSGLIEAWWVKGFPTLGGPSRGFIGVRQGYLDLL